MKIRKKLIEVALPLDAINKASAREKSIRHGHPSTLHLWWARRPLAAARAVIFSQMVDDPSGYVDVLKGDPKKLRAAESELKKRLKVWEEVSATYERARGAKIEAPEPGPMPELDEIVAEKERERLFKIIERLVLWESTTNEGVLQEARDEIWASWRRTCAENADHPRAAELFNRDKLPAFHDPFAGGGALPLEAQRLGLEAYASDLNPVAVLINKAMIEIPPKFAGRPPVNPEWQNKPEAEKAMRTWKGAQGLAEDVRYYGKWMRDEAEKRIGHLYPKVKAIKQKDGTYRHATPEEIANCKSQIENLTVIAWLWARTVKSPNPAFAQVDVPLASTFMLSTKAGKEAYVEPVIENGLPAPSPGRFFVYAIECEGGSHYIGHTDDVPRRWEEHCEGRGADWTNAHKPVRLAYYEEADSREAAVAREKELKTGFGRKWLKDKIASAPARQAGGYRFTVKVGKPKDAEGAKNGTKLSRGANFQCLMSATPIASDHIYSEAQAGRIGARLMAIVAEGDRVRVYLAPTPEMEAIALTAQPTWEPELAMPENPRWFSPPLYGLKTYGDLFTPRQLVALTTFSDLVQEARERVQRDALAAGLPADPKPLRDGGTGATAYAEAVGVYLGFTVSRQANRACTISFWDNTSQKIQQAFGRQALPMTWDFCESNPFSDSSGSWLGQLIFPAKSLDAAPANIAGFASQQDAQQQGVSADKLVSTDPPYYDNIGYADLSDFFFVWLRRSLRPVFPDLFATLAVPKAEELVATPYRHGSKEKAETFFLDGMTQAMHRLAEQAHPAFPVTIYYAFKQAEGDGVDGTASTGWDTFLAAVIEAGFAISGTWPMRTELTGNLKKNVGALASSIILVCRPRAADAPTATRREFVAALNDELPQALAHLQRGNIAPVDLAQAAIGPGMSVFTRYAKVLDAQGKALSVREALALINETLDTALASQEGDFDPDSRWALAWFEQYGFEEGEYGVAETLSKAKNTSVQGVVDAGFAVSARGKVRILRPSELPETWTPEGDKRLTHWDMVHHLIRVLETKGDVAAAELVRALGAKAETARELCYRLYTVCERKKWANEARSYNGLVQNWPELVRLAQEKASQPAVQENLFD